MLYSIIGSSSTAGFCVHMRDGVEMIDLKRRDVCHKGFPSFVFMCDVQWLEASAAQL